MFSYEGLVAATVTPTKADGSINCDAIPGYVSFLLQQNVKAVFVNGTTGEWSSFSVEERKHLAEAWIKYGRNKLHKIIIHCGALSTEDAKTLARHAVNLGADAIACIAPCFFRPQNEEFLVEYLREVASAAPTTPFLYYHLPGFTKVEVKMEVFLKLAHERIATFCGMKLSSPKLYDVYHCLQFKNKDLALFYGCDEQLFPALMVGVKAAVGSLYNYLGRYFNEILSAVEKNEFSKAKDIQIKLAMDMIPMHEKYGFFTRRKWLTECIEELWAKASPKH
ncbi:N-acetylneuraminate lyase-like isoform X2 [Hydractinia symbiolongicarpus]|uniref:N-acetylneuraminate lyase-like isoform X2 n=1 Tax=Hydractinia symbiolongicarpus TaxID=13093 RepID=UPI0025505609|nr:N-acetylneuraminate lyase-like isoform X2 [Hydractinia symbiolongicarpus]